MAAFWVVGGEYKHTGFREAVGEAEDWVGPFPDYESARQEWARHAWQSVDHASVRYRIECIDPDEAPPCTD